MDFLLLFSAEFLKVFIIYDRQKSFFVVDFGPLWILTAGIKDIERVLSRDRHRKQSADSK